MINQKLINSSQQDTQDNRNPRQKLLDEARVIVSKDRTSGYGNPEDNFLQIAALWTAYKGQQFTSMDVALMCALIKVARLAKSPEHHDSLVDIAGYAACGADIQVRLIEEISALNNI